MKQNPEPDLSTRSPEDEEAFRKMAMRIAVRIAAALEKKP